MEPRHLTLLRRAAEAASDEAHRVEGLYRSHHDQVAITAAIKSALATERRACAAYRRAFNAQIAANEAAIQRLAA